MTFSHKIVPYIYITSNTLPHLHVHQPSERPDLVEIYF